MDYIEDENRERSAIIGWCQTRPSIVHCLVLEGDGPPGGNQKDVLGQCKEGIDLLETDAVDEAPPGLGTLV